MSKKKNTDGQKNPKIVNRKARFDYQILDTIEVGIALVGSEVKSIRQAQVSLAEGFARVETETMELFLYNVDIAPYSHTNVATAPDRLRRRKLLAKKREIDKLATQTAVKGTTLVPLAIYFVRGMAKLQLGVGRGKKTVDKRQTVKTRDADREIRRSMTRKII